MLIAKCKKLRNSLSKFKSFVLEPKLLKKKEKEMLFIEKINTDLGRDYKCENFNELTLNHAKVRKESSFSFLQIGMPLGFTKLFFMALMKKNQHLTLEL